MLERIWSSRYSFFFFFRIKPHWTTIYLYKAKWKLHLSSGQAILLVRYSYTYAQRDIFVVAYDGKLQSNSLNELDSHVNIFLKISKILL